MYGNYGSITVFILYSLDKPQHLMYGNKSLSGSVYGSLLDKPQHLMYGNNTTNVKVKPAIFW